MSDDPLLTALGRVAAEQAREREAHEKTAATASDASLDRWTSAVLAQRETESRSAAKVIPIRSRRLAWAGFAAIPIAAAAAFALLATRASDLPGYTLSVAGGVRDERGMTATTANEPIAVSPRSEIVLSARPDASVKGSVHTSTFVIRAGAALPVPSTSESSDQGALRVTVRGEDLTKAAGAVGTYDLVLVVGRSDDADRSALTAKDETKHGDWIRFTVPVRINEAAH